MYAMVIDSIGDKIYFTYGNIEMMNTDCIMFVAVVSNVYQLYLILTNRENTSCVDKYILRVASVVRCVAAQYRVHIMTSSFFKQTQCC